MLMQIPTRVKFCILNYGKNFSSQKNKPELTLVSAKYQHDFFIILTFANGKTTHTTVKDFLPLFQQYVRGDYIKYFAPANFKKFTVKNGNIYWGKDEDVIFPSNMLADKSSSTTKEDILFII